MFERDKDNFESFGVWGPDPEKEDHYLVRAHNGNDKAGIWSYDARNKKFAELIYRRSDVDAGGVFSHSNRMKFPDTPAGVSWCKDKCYREFLIQMRRLYIVNSQNLSRMRARLGFLTGPRTVIHLLLLTMRHGILDHII